MALEGKTILLTRARGQNAELGRILEDEGATVLEIPTIEIREPETWQPVEDAISELDDYDWIVFTSANAVEAFQARAAGRTLPRVAAVGAQTARRLEVRGVRVDLVPEDYRSEGLLAALPGDLAGLRFLLPRGDLADDRLPDGLRARGARVDGIVVYRTLMPSEGSRKLRDLLAASEIDCVVFTSGSTIRNLVAMLGGDDPSVALRSAAIAVLGPVTAKAARDLGLEVAIEAPGATAAALAGAIREFFR